MYRKCCPKWFKSIETALEKRVTVLSRLYIFNDWHREDLVFLARWMVDKDYLQVRQLMSQPRAVGAVMLTCAS